MLIGVWETSNCWYCWSPLLSIASLWSNGSTLLFCPKKLLAQYSWWFDIVDASGFFSAAAIASVNRCTTTLDFVTAARNEWAVSRSNFFFLRQWPLINRSFQRLYSLYVCRPSWLQFFFVVHTLTIPFSITIKYKKLIYDLRYSFLALYHNTMQAWSYPVRASSMFWRLFQKCQQ